MGDFEKGYTKIDNRILEVLQKTQLNGSQTKIIFCILRATYGFNKKEFEMSLSFISKSTGLDSTRISKELKDLVDRKIVKIYKQSTFTNPKSIGINKIISQWVLSKVPTVGETANSTVGETANSTVGETANQKIHNKNTYIKIHNHRANSLHSATQLHDYDDDFSKFWNLYPKKINKRRCYEYFQEENLYSQLDDILKGLEYLIEVDYSKKERQFIPMPLAFLQDERWKDYKEEKKGRLKLGEY